MTTLRIAQAQINPTVGDLAGNAALIADSIASAKRAGAHVVTLPECALSGYPPEDLLLKPRFVRDCRDALESVVDECEGICAVVGFPDGIGDEVYNAAAVIADGRICGVYHKIELPNYGVFDERRYFTPGSGPLVIELHGVRLSVTICEDVWIESNAVEQQVRDHAASIVLNLSGSPFHAGKLAQRRDIAGAFARRTGAYLCYNNLVGGQDELVFDGGSLVIGPQGQLLASAKRFEPDLLLADITVGKGQAERPAAHGPHVIALAEFPSAAGPSTSVGTVTPVVGRIEEIYRALVLGTRDYVRKNGFEKVTLGLSGGIDSSLTAAVAVDALGAENVIGVTMPSQYTSTETRSDAEQLAANLGIRVITVPIKEVFAAYMGVLAEPFGDGEAGLACENLQARIRGNILMALSNQFGWLVLTTGNKSEVAVGYCTLYGDMAGGFAVIKDVPKTMVYELSELVNQRAGREAIPQSVIERPPSAELRPDQKDEDSLPPYAVLDPILKAYVEEDQAPDDIASAGFHAEVVHEVVRLLHRSEYKRRQSPPGVKITPKAFGRDRRLPITNRYRT